MTIKQHGGIFGRNPTFNEVAVGNDIAKLTQNGTNAYLDTEKFQIRAPDGSLVGLQYNPDDSGRIQLRYAGNTKLQTTGTGVSVTGNVAVSDGGGIDFSATSGTGTSELFDDYEEGTWTPTYVPQTGTFTSATYSAQTGTYTKVGDTVHAFFDLSATIDVTGASGNVTISGLPFSGLSTACFGGVGRARRFANTFTFGGFLTSGSSLILYKQDTDDLNYINLNVTDLATGGVRNFITAGVTYKVS